MKKFLLLSLLISTTYCTNNSTNPTNETLATVNSRNINKETFIQQAQSVANTPGTNLNNIDGRTNLLKDMINEELVFQLALKENFHLQNLDVKHEIVRQFLKQKFSKNIPVISDEQTKQYYDQQKDQLDKVRASHILIGVKKEDDEKTKLAAKQKAEKIRTDIINKKISFLDAVAQFSTDSGSKDKGGDLDFFTKDRMVAPFSKAAFDMKKIGEISPVVESEHGYHIILLTGEDRGYDVYKERIRWKLYQDSMQPMIDEFFKDLRENAKIEILKSDLGEIKIPQM